MIKISKEIKEAVVFKKAIKILEARVGILSNKKNLLPLLPLKIEVKSLLTDFHSVDEIPYAAGLDGYISIEDRLSEELRYNFSPRKVKFIGSFLKLTKEASDLRFSLWGNQGFLYRYSLYLLEKNHSIFNFHACGLYEEKKNWLYVIAGGAGSGKTVYLLSGLDKGLKLFSTETVHFRIEKEKVTWFMGSLIDNIRLGTLIHNFPRFLPQKNIPVVNDEWQKKIALDLSSYKNNCEQITNPEVILLFPRIEEGRKHFLLIPIKDRRIAAKTLFDNISEKLSETVILYDKLPLLGLDNQELALNRLRCVTKLVHQKTLAQIASVLSNPAECWGKLLE